MFVLMSLFFALSSWSLTGAPNSVAANPQNFQIVVHINNSTSAISRAELERLFLKGSPKWSDGTKAYPVDLDSEAQVRKAFSASVLKRDVSSVKAFWQQMIFSGRAVPPPELATDDEVLSYIEGNPQAIGYASSQANLSARLKTIPVR